MIMSPKRSYKVIVIGAGVSGISAAHHLALNGLRDVLVLEARDRLGGRVHSMKNDLGPLELGAQWIQGGCPANSMYNLANSLSLMGEEIQRYNDSTGSSDDLLQWPSTFGYIYRSTGLPLSEEATKQAYETFNAIRDEVRHYYRREFKVNRTNRTVRDKNRLLTFYNSRMKKAVESLRRENEHPKAVLDEVEDALSGFRNALSLWAGEDLEQCRLELTGANSDLPGGFVSIPGGVVGLLEAMVRKLDKDTVKLNRRVTLVDWSLLSRGAEVMDKVVVECVTSEGHVEEYLADYVITTLPLPVLKRYHQQLFYPGLDQRKLQSMQAIGCGHIAKLFLQWTSPWWAPGEGGITLAWNSAEMKARILPRDWFLYISAFSEVEAQPNLLVCWVAGSGARVVDQLEDEEIIQKVTQVLQAFTGDPGLTKPKSLCRTAWSTEQFSLGSLTFPAMTTEEQDFHNLSSPLPSDKDPRLLFAGEATHATYFSTMHGARLAGLREANRVLERVEAMEKMSLELDKISSTRDWQLRE